MQNVRPIRSLSPVTVAAIGFSSLITQIIFLRESLTVFYGNELIIGIVFACWMASTALGSYAGKFVARSSAGSRLHAVLFTLLGILPPITVLLLRYLRNIVFVEGNMLGIVEILLSSLAIVLPYCFTAGVLFTLLAGRAADDGRRHPLADVYSWESWGSVAGGALCALLFVFYLTSLQSLLAVFVANLLSAFLLARGSRVMRAGVALLLVAGTALLLRPGADMLTKGYLFRGQQLLYTHDTPFGNLAVTRQGDQDNIFQNGVLIATTGDRVPGEESVHYAMVQHRSPKRVLIISGAFAGTIEEIQKYSVAHIDVVEINPWMISLLKRYARGLDDPGVTVVNEDARQFVRRCAGEYDIVLLNTSDPVTAADNRYYTVEFFRDVKNIMTPGGIFSLRILENFDYYGPPAKEIASTLYSTVSSVFRNVVIIPGSTKVYYIASASALTTRVAQLISARNIGTTYVNRYYIDDDVVAQRSRDLTRSLERSAALNSDFAPVAYYQQLNFWLSYFDVHPWIFAGAGVALLILAIASLDAVTFGIAAGGFAGAALELLVIFAFQIVFGYVYEALSIIIMIFMAGLALGSRYAPQFCGPNPLKSFSYIQFGAALCACALPWLFRFLGSAWSHSWMVEGVLFFMTLVIAVLIGSEFSLASALREGPVAASASRLYGADLAGAAVGALLVSSILIPRLGIFNVSYLVGGLSAAGGFAALLRIRVKAAVAT